MNLDTAGMERVVQSQWLKMFATSQAFPSILFSSTAMDSGSNEATRLWRVYRTAHQMVHDRVGITYRNDNGCSDQIVV